MLAHDIEPSANESGVDFNIELLFKRPAATYRSSLANILLRPRFHVGTSINLDGDTSQLYAGLTWDMPLAPKWSLEVSFGGALHDGPTDASGAHSYGCALNFREVHLARLPGVGPLARVRHRHAHVERRPVRLQQRPDQRRRALRLHAELTVSRFVRPPLFPEMRMARCGA